MTSFDRKQRIGGWHQGKAYKAETTESQRMKIKKEVRDEQLKLFEEGSSSQRPLQAMVLTRRAVPGNGSHSGGDCSGFSVDSTRDLRDDAACSDVRTRVRQNATYGGSSDGSERLGGHYRIDNLADTSQEMFRKLNKELSDLESLILRAIEDCGPMTSSEVSETINKGILSVRPTMTIMKKSQLLYDTGLRRKNKTENSERVLGKKQ